MSYAEEARKRRWRDGEVALERLRRRVRDRIDVTRGCAPPPGWVGLFEDLALDATRILPKSARAEFAIARAERGRLRVSWSASGVEDVEVLHAVAERVRQAEDACRSTCEECGHEGSLTCGPLWSRTLCATHAEQAKRLDAHMPAAGAEGA